MGESDENRPSARITIDQIYTLLTDVHGLVQGLTAREVSMNDKIIEQTKQLQDHETRIRSNERWRWAIPATLVIVAVEIFRNV